MISTLLFLFMLIVCGILIIASLVGFMYEYWIDVFAAVGGTMILWISAILFAAGYVGESVVVPVSQKIVGELTNITYDTMQIPTHDSAVSLILIGMSLCVTLYTIYLVFVSIYDSLPGGDYS